VVVVAGRYRSGKSFLLNRGVLQTVSERGFHTGNTINACTKGIWVHPAPVHIGGLAAVVLDTEGTGSMEASPEQDARLISIAMCLASLFIYNSKEALDEASFSEGGILSHAAQALQDAGEWTPPSLVWTLRDFSLRLVKPDGSALTPDEYLERALSEPGETRALLRAFFSRRTLFPFVRPVANEADLQELNSLPLADLRPEFVQQIDAFQRVLGDFLEPKRIAGCAAGGDVLAHLCARCVDAVNQGAVPTVRDSLCFLLELELKDALGDMERASAEQLTRTLASLPCPPETVEIRQMDCPRALQAHAAFRERFEEEAAAARSRIHAEVTRRNEAERKRWLKDYMRLGRADFADFLRAAPPVLGAEHTVEASLLVYEATQEARRLKEAEDEGTRLALEKEAARLRQQCLDGDARQERVRQELDDMLRPAQLASADSELARVLADELSEAQAAESQARALHEDAEDEAARLRQRCEHERELDLRQPERVSELESHAGLLQDELRRVRSELHHSATQEEERLVQMRQEMLAHVSSAKQRFESRESALRGELAHANARAVAECQDAEAARLEHADARRARQHAVEEFQSYRAESQEESARLKSEHFDAMLEKTSFAMSEVRRAREEAAQTEHGRLRVQIENETNKRRLDQHREELQNLAKSRQLTEDLRERLAESTATARTSQALLDDARRRLAHAQRQQQESAAAHSEALRARDYRIALLEVELKSRR
jgi:hypothetical protein